jgi:hypothetical protein
MYTRANRASVSDSARALVGSIVAFLMVFVALAIAVTTVPVRLLRARTNGYGKPASMADVQVQVYLNDRARATDIERSCRTALGRAARTWAPFPLPVDRVEVIPTAPPLGKAEIFGEWMPLDDGSGTLSLAIVSIGTSVDGRELTADEIAGALAGQIERLVVERYQREHPKTETLTRRSPHEAVRAASTMEPPEAVTARQHEIGTPGDNVTDLSVARILAEIKKSQPLVPAGSFTNGVHSEPDPAS